MKLISYILLLILLTSAASAAGWSTYIPKHSDTYDWDIITDGSTINAYDTSGILVQTAVSSADDSNFIADIINNHMEDHETLDLHGTFDIESSRTLTRSVIIDGYDAIFSFKLHPAYYITIDDNITIEGLRVTGNTKYMLCLFEVHGRSDQTLVPNYPPLTVNFHKCNFYDIRADTAQSIEGHGCIAEPLNGANTLRVTECTFDNVSVDLEIIRLGGRNSVVDKCNFYNCSAYCAGILGGVGNTISNNYALNPVGAFRPYMAAFWTNSRFATVYSPTLINNEVEWDHNPASEVSAYLVSAEQYWSALSHNMTSPRVLFNKARSNPSHANMNHGLYCHRSTADNSRVRNITAIGNQFYGMGTGIQTFGISGGTFSFNDIENSRYNGIWLTDTNNMSVIGNNIRNFNFNNSATVYGISCVASDTLIKDNYVLDEYGNSTYSIYDGTATGGNIIEGGRVDLPVYKNPSGTSAIRWVDGYATENSGVLSGTFAIDSTGVKTVQIAHGLSITPSNYRCALTVLENTNVDDWACSAPKVDSTNVTHVVAKINVTSASLTGGATAKLGLVIN